MATIVATSVVALEIYHHPIKRYRLMLFPLARNKISLSMRNVDQKMGQDLLPMKSSLDEESNPSSLNQPSTGHKGLPRIIITEEDENGSSRRRISSHERWEAEQLILSRVLV
ncbi:hypothetical protein GOP47_0015083 [Adiantum capillus-veneris]|uniref:Uncharacterized protein n=1 Tax=Adiantum capillus-veneris TaxID=13818 RepID=A0A9D4UMN7_ADICA|nr:hypothetical protein GOP47_0015083 [Adiantum capillus-veneris]